MRIITLRIKFSYDIEPVKIEDLLYIHKYNRLKYSVHAV